MSLTIEERLAHIETMLADMATVPAAVHDRRVASLLRANNELVEARRAATDRALKAENLAFQMGATIRILIGTIERLQRNSTGVAGFNMGEEILDWVAFAPGAAFAGWLGDAIADAEDQWRAAFGPKQEGAQDGR